MNGQGTTGELHERSLSHRRSVASKIPPDPEEDVLDGAIREGDLAADGAGVVWARYPEPMLSHAWKRSNRRPTTTGEQNLGPGHT